MFFRSVLGRSCFVPTLKKTLDLSGHWPPVDGRASLEILYLWSGAERLAARIVNFTHNFDGPDRIQLVLASQGDRVVTDAVMVRRMTAPSGCSRCLGGEALTAEIDRASQDLSRWNDHVVASLPALLFLLRRGRLSTSTSDSSEAGSFSVPVLHWELLCATYPHGHFTASSSVSAPMVQSS
jgi:hypothetical protein